MALLLNKNVTRKFGDGAPIILKSVGGSKRAANTICRNARRRFCARRWVAGKPERFPARNSLIETIVEPVRKANGAERDVAQDVVEKGRTSGAASSKVS
ncbi:MAG TPA: hypothetical protein VGV39_11730 [Mesorhizobium sp.]|jgi:hypothetical protein|uniref:hypothetical protein n=1 Tax=Mesorhizobium sp. TaxID=1871066 RepID=UPI002DDD367C|nr:hypothetical protein [Mesorhizobium sp.]HEV2503740.1 hypothetical protein [Mesorhizobium sp.]